MFLSLKMEDLGKISQLTSKGSIDYNIVRKVNLILSKNADVPHIGLGNAKLGREK